ncbi:MAG TPA: hypothetical protein DEA51_03280 [Erysipelotrichaceae bacterium]|nr:hypothetical protein [Erysipelotrichaceae bacterium]
MQNMLKLLMNSRFHLFLSMFMFLLSLNLFLNFFVEIRSWEGYLFLLLSLFFTALSAHLINKNSESEKAKNRNLRFPTKI